MFEGDPARVHVERNWFGQDAHRIVIESAVLRDLADAADFGNDFNGPLEALVEIWTQPLRSPEHLRNWKFRLEREWPELYNAIDGVVKSLTKAVPDYEAWLKEHKTPERKS
jgi:hypothetical protein